MTRTKLFAAAAVVTLAGLLPACAGNTADDENEKAAKDDDVEVNVQADEGLRTKASKVDALTVKQTTPTTTSSN